MPFVKTEMTAFKELDMCSIKKNILWNKRLLQVSIFKLHSKPLNPSSGKHITGSRMHERKEPALDVNTIAIKFFPTISECILLEYEILE